MQDGLVLFFIFRLSRIVATVGLWLANFRRGVIFFVVATCLSAPVVAPAWADVVTVAVATNFLSSLRQIAIAYEKNSNDHLRIVSGSTGGLYAKIQNGAPYDVFLAADQVRPHRLETRGRGVPGTRFTYAVGRLALWTKSGKLETQDGPTVLRMGAFDHIAIANPKLAPYGAAALQLIQGLGLERKLTPKLVYGQNIGQTFQFVATGGAAFGFVALSQLQGQTQILAQTQTSGQVQAQKGASGTWWVAPRDMHAPIKQDAIAVAGRPDPARARAFLRFLQSPQALAIIQTQGYDIPVAPMVNPPAGG